MYPEVNHCIDVTVTNLNHSWNAIVTEIGDKEILIFFPHDQNVLNALRIGTIMEVSFVVHENRYKFSTEIIGMKNTLFKVKKPLEKEIFSCQLRRNFRAPLNIPLYLNDKKAITIDLSSGGISCLCRPEMKFKKGEVVSGTISLPSFSSSEHTLITFKGKIIRVNFIEGLERNNVALKFIEITQQDQLKIKQYCFDKQLKIKSNEDYISTTGFRTF